MSGWLLPRPGSILAAVALLVGSVQAACPPPAQDGLDSAPEVMCPVMTDEPVDPRISIEWEGRRVYFCCKMCRKTFLADPEEYRAVLPPESVYASLFGPPADATGGNPPADGAVAPALDATPRIAPAAAVGEQRPAAIPAGPPIPSVLERLGRGHVIAVHFPIALLIGAGLAELLGRREAARFCLAVGAAGALVAVSLGLIAAEHATYPSMSEVVFRHRWLGIGTATLAVLAWKLAPTAGAVVDPKRERIYRALLLGAALAVALTGHHSGMLIFGRDWLLG